VTVVRGRWPVVGRREGLLGRYKKETTRRSRRSRKTIDDNNDILLCNLSMATAIPDSIVSRRLHTETLLAVAMRSINFYSSSFNTITHSFLPALSFTTLISSAAGPCFNFLLQAPFIPAMSLKRELETWIAALDAYDAHDFLRALELFSVRFHSFAGFSESSPMLGSQLMGTSSKIRTNMGLIYATLGEHDMAVEQFRLATDLDQYLAVACVPSDACSAATRPTHRLAIAISKAECPISCSADTILLCRISQRH
jgi:hypothetical protein